MTSKQGYKRIHASTPSSPSKAPDKKQAMESDAAENIIATLKMAIEAQGANIEKNFSDLKTTINFISEDIKELKGKMSHTEKRVGKAEEKIQVLENKVNELSRYKRRWNLRLHGLGEEDGEDVRRKVMEICQNMAPNHAEKFPEVLDSVHRLGKRRDTTSPPLPRAVIMQFTMRHFRDIIWKAAKKSDYLMAKKLRIKEDLSPEDRERRNQLWPIIEKARKEGKSAYFVGARAFVDRKEIHCQSEAADISDM